MNETENNLLIGLVVCLLAIYSSLWLLGQYRQNCFSLFSGRSAAEIRVLCS